MLHWQLPELAHVSTQDVHASSKFDPRILTSHAGKHHLTNRAYARNASSVESLAYWRLIGAARNDRARAGATGLIIAGQKVRRRDGGFEKSGTACKPPAPQVPDPDAASELPAAERGGVPANTSVMLQHPCPALLLRLRMPAAAPPGAGAGMKSWGIDQRASARPRWAAAEATSPTRRAPTAASAPDRGSIATGFRMFKVARKAIGTLVKKAALRLGAAGPVCSDERADVVSLHRSAASGRTRWSTQCSVCWLLQRGAHETRRPTWFAPEHQGSEIALAARLPYRSAESRSVLRRPLPGLVGLPWDAPSRDLRASSPHAESQPTASRTAENMAGYPIHTATTSWSKVRVGANAPEIATLRCRARQTSKHVRPDAAPPKTCKAPPSARGPAPSTARSPRPRWRPTAAAQSRWGRRCVRS